ncbi:MAG: hydrogenase [Alphaproteobacteria bacterium]
MPNEFIMIEINQPLALAGVVLFLLGLLNGFVIPLGRSPRLGLSAHLTAVQSGTFLIAMGLLWPYIDFPVIWRETTAYALWVSLYALWLALFFAGLLGAGRGLPIAGGGVETKATYQAAVSALLYTGILGTTMATFVVVYWMTV